MSITKNVNLHKRHVGLYKPCKSYFLYGLHSDKNGLNCYSQTNQNHMYDKLGYICDRLRPNFRTHRKHTKIGLQRVVNS